MAKKTTTTKDPMLDFVVGEFVRYEAAHSDRFSEAERAYDHWMNKPPRRDYNWQNAVHVPMMVEGEQTITPRLFTALFPTDAPIDVKVEGDTPPAQGIRIKGMIAHHFRIADVQGESHPALSQCTLFGTGYVEGGSWFIKRGWQHDETTGERYNALIENRPDCKFVSFFEIFPHPAKRSMDDGLPLVRRRYCDAEFLKKLPENGMQIKNLDDALQSNTPIKGKAGKWYNTKKRDEYEILEYWGPWDASYEQDSKVVNKQAIPYWIIVINRTVVIRAIANPYNHQMPPFCKIILIPDPKNPWFGIGIGKIGRSSQERLNKLVNQRLDNVDLVLNKQGCYNGNDTLINTKKLQVSKPGLWHKVSDTVTSLRWMDMPDVTKSSYQEETLAKQDFREATGATTELMPAGDQHRTAMGIQLLQGAAGMRFRPILRKMETDLIQRLAMFFFSNLKQFMTEAEWILITGKNGQVEPVLVTPEQIQAKVFFIPTGISETMNKEIQVGQLLRFKEVTMNDPTVNRQEINRRIAELFGFKDIEKLMTPIQTPVRAGMSQNDQLMIRQRMAEGANPDQIKQEMLGPPPLINPNTQQVAGGR